MSRRITCRRIVCPAVFRGKERMMRTTFLALSVASIAALLVGARPAMAEDSWANKIFGGQPGTPVMQDFGVVAGGAQLQAVLKMTNIYKVPLTITHVEVSCGCVKTEPDTKDGKPAMVLPPNGTGNFIINMDGTRFAGHKEVKVSVTFGPQFVSTATILVQANARQDVVLNPGKIDFGVVGRGQQIQPQTIDVECAGIRDWKVIGFQPRSATAPFALRMDPLPLRMANNAPIVGYRLTANLRPDAPAGKFSETVELRTNNPIQPVVTFLVVGSVESPVVAEPSNLQVAGLHVGSPQMRQIVVRANQPFKITNVQGNGTDIRLVPDNASRPVHIVQVQVTPQQPGVLSREFVLQTDMGGESVVVHVQGTVNP
jgi:hypothetical protein